MPSWREMFRKHYDRAESHHDDARSEGHTVGWGIAGLISALLALVTVQRAQAQELAKIRKLLEAQQSPTADRFYLVGVYVPKEGVTVMSAGPFSPTEAEDVLLAISPVNAAGAPVPGPFAWTTSDGSAVSLSPADDGLTCKAVTAAGPIDCVVTVTQTASGRSEAAIIRRAPVDNSVAQFNLSGQTVPKA